uniref:Uncharacterized protein n=1 Tax=Plectus sambesii TaxID=2011161 RepID=A0A914V082_9BILA
MGRPWTLETDAIDRRALERPRQSLERAMDAAAAASAVFALLAIYLFADPFARSSRRSHAPPRPPASLPDWTASIPERRWPAVQNRRPCDQSAESSAQIRLRPARGSGSAPRTPAGRPSPVESNLPCGYNQRAPNRTRLPSVLLLLALLAGNFFSPDTCDDVATSGRWALRRNQSGRRSPAACPPVARVYPFVGRSAYACIGFCW